MGFVAPVAEHVGRELVNLASNGYLVDGALVGTAGYYYKKKKAAE